MNYKAAIEAILFTMGESVELGRIADAIQLNEKETKKLLDELIERVSKSTSVSTLFLGCFAMRMRYSYICGFVHI